ELARRWAPSVYGGFVKQATHRALDDIRESIAELAHYRRHLFAPEFRGGI
ncbi:MAG: oligoribonuclease, partial [Gammaproteobacteria bacterium]|nr:oligoribonuclease [Gammaproteobacteria bacterium]